MIDWKRWSRTLRPLDGVRCGFCGINVEDASPPNEEFAAEDVGRTRAGHGRVDTWDLGDVAPVLHSRSKPSDRCCLYLSLARRGDKITPSLRQPRGDRSCYVLRLGNAWFKVGRVKVSLIFSCETRRKDESDAPTSPWRSP